jgi:ribonuclease inhibitor
MQVNNVFSRGENMMKYILDGKKIASRNDFYDELKRSKLPLPSHFGRNLDALWDVLTADLAGPLEIIWNASGSSRSAMGNEEHDQLVRLLLDAAVERDDLKVTIHS